LRWGRPEEISFDKRTVDIRGTGPDSEYTDALLLMPLWKTGIASAKPRENAFAAVVWPRRARGEVLGCYTKFTSIAA